MLPETAFGARCTSKVRSCRRSRDAHRVRETELPERAERPRGTESPPEEADRRWDAGAARGRTAGVDGASRSRSAGVGRGEDGAGAPPWFSAPDRARRLRAASAERHAPAGPSQEAGYVCHSVRVHRPRAGCVRLESNGRRRALAPGCLAARLGLSPAGAPAGRFSIHSVWEKCDIGSGGFFRAGGRGGTQDLPGSPADLQESREADRRPAGAHRRSRFPGYPMARVPSATRGPLPAGGERGAELQLRRDHRGPRPCRGPRGAALSGHRAPRLALRSTGSIHAGWGEWDVRTGGFFTAGEEESGPGAQGGRGGPRGGPRHAWPTRELFPGRQARGEAPAPPLELGLSLITPNRASPEPRRGSPGGPWPGKSSAVGPAACVSSLRFRRAHARPRATTVARATAAFPPENGRSTSGHVKSMAGDH